MAESAHRTFVAAKLRALGCQVFCAADLDEAADLVRAGLPSDLVVVHLGPECLSVPLLQAEMARRLPGWTLSTYGGFDRDEIDEIAEPRRLVN